MRPQSYYYSLLSLFQLIMTRIDPPCIIIIIWEIIPQYLAVASMASNQYYFLYHRHHAVVIANIQSCRSSWHNNRNCFGKEASCTRERQLVWVSDSLLCGSCFLIIMIIECSRSVFFHLFLTYQTLKKCFYRKGVPGKGFTYFSHKRILDAPPPLKNTLPWSSNPRDKTISSRACSQLSYALLRHLQQVSAP